MPDDDIDVTPNGCKNCMMTESVDVFDYDYLSSEVESIFNYLPLNSSNNLQDNYIQYVMDNVDNIHKEQKKIVENYYKEYLPNVNGDNNIIFEPIDIYPFYTGLVGSKLVNNFNKPTILFPIV